MLTSTENIDDEKLSSEFENENPFLESDNNNSITLDKLKPSSNIKNYIDEEKVK